MLWSHCTATMSSIIKLLAFSVVCISQWTIGDAIHIFSLERCKELECEQQATWGPMLYLVALASSVLLSTFLLRFGGYCIPEAVGSIFLGMVFGSISVGDGGEMPNLMTLDSDIFIGVFLPLIIFEAGYSVYNGQLFRSVGTIVLFSLLGSVAMSCLVGVLLYGGAEATGHSLLYAEALAMGAALSAVDPVAANSVFHSLGLEVHPLQDGQTAVSMAASIGLFSSLVSGYGTPEAMDSLISLEAIVQFLMNFFASLIIAAPIALTSALITKHWKGLNDSPSAEVAFVFVMGVFPYYVCESLNLSGVFGVLYSSLIMGHYTHYNISETSQIAITQSLKATSFVSEIIIYFYLGVTVVQLAHAFNPVLTLFTLLVYAAVRAGTLFPLSAIANIMRHRKIEGHFQLSQWILGVQGTVAFGLGSQLVAEPNGESIAMTLATVSILSLLFQCLFAKTLMKRIFPKNGTVHPLILTKIAGQTEAIALKKKEEKAAGGGAKKGPTVKKLPEKDAFGPRCPPFEKRWQLFGTFVLDRAEGKVSDDVLRALANRPNHVAVQQNSAAPKANATKDKGAAKGGAPPPKIKEKESFLQELDNRLLIPLFRKYKPKPVKITESKELMESASLLVTSLESSRPRSSSRERRSVRISDTVPSAPPVEHINPEPSAAATGSWPYDMFNEPPKATTHGGPDPFRRLPGADAAVSSYDNNRKV